MRGASPGLPAPRTQHNQEQMTFLQPPAVRASAFRSEPAGADRSLWGSVLGLLTSGLGWGGFPHAGPKLGVAPLQGRFAVFGLRSGLRAQRAGKQNRRSTASRPSGGRS